MKAGKAHYIEKHIWKQKIRLCNISDNIQAQYDINVKLRIEGTITESKLQQWKEVRQGNRDHHLDKSEKTIET